MISHSLWYLDQWHRSKWGWNFTRDLMLAHDDTPFAAPAIVGHGVFTGIVAPTTIAASPYAFIQKGSIAAASSVSHQAENLAWSRAMGYRVGKRQVAKFALTKVASRFVPYVGWGLLAYDLWNLGKWIGHKTS